MKDISPTLGANLDEKSALEHFLGRDRQDAVDLLRRYEDRIHVYLEDFLWMGEAAFVYYFPALLEFIDGLDVKSRVDRLETVLGYVEIRCKHGGLKSVGSASLIAAFCEKYSAVARLAGNGDMRKLMKRFPSEE